MFQHPTSRYTVEADEFDIMDDELIEKVKIVNNIGRQCHIKVA